MLLHPLESLVVVVVVVVVVRPESSRNIESNTSTSPGVLVLLAFKNFIPRLIYLGTYY
jgi:hypothetical protein